MSLLPSPPLHPVRQTGWINLDISDINSIKVGISRIISPGPQCHALLVKIDGLERRLEASHRELLEMERTVPLFDQYLTSV